MDDEITETTKKQVRTLIKKIAGTYNLDIVEIINATIISVDKDKRTCVVTPLSGKSDTNIEDVGLMPERNDGEFKIPKVGSTVGIVISTFVDPYIVSWSDLDEWYLIIGTTKVDILSGTIKFGDGSFNGLIKIDDLKTQWDANVTAIKTAVAAGLAVVDAQLNTLGQAGGSATAFNSSAVNIKVLNKTTLENTKIKHGTI